MELFSGLRQNPKAENGDLKSEDEVTVNDSDSLPSIDMEAWEQIKTDNISWTETWKILQESMDKTRIITQTISFIYSTLYVIIILSLNQFLYTMVSWIESTSTTYFLITFRHV